jgi:hypothetical protein
MSDHLSTQRGNAHKRTHEQAEELPQHGTSLADFYGQGLQANVVCLQATIGNQATQRLLATGIQRGIGDKIKAKLAESKYKKALANNAKDKQALLDAVDQGLTKRSTDRRLANSCEWIKTAQKAKLYAVTTTSDSRKRIKAAGMNVSADMALFPDGSANGDDHIYGATTPSYNYNDVTDNAGVHLDPDGQVTGGWRLPGLITIYNARNSPLATIWSTIRHEVQHDADQSTDKKTNAGGAGTLEGKFERYKTEYRAYHYQQTGYEGLSMTKDVNKYGYTWKEKQLAIFEHIFSGYQHTQDFWDDSGPSNTPSTKDAPNDNTIGALAKQAIAARQARLVAYINPDTEGFNKWNSVRVDNFYKALKDVPDNTDDISHEKMVVLLEKVAALAPEDCRYIRDESPDFKTLMAQKLKDSALTTIQDTISVGVTKK